MWVIHDGNRELVLKVVRNDPGRLGLPSEAEKLIKLYQNDPSIVDDRAIAFPVKIFHCVGPSGDRNLDIIVMKKASGAPLSDVLFQLFHAGELVEVGSILKQLGMFLKQFHQRYGNMQHGDFGPENIFYDASSRSFSLVDVADLGRLAAEGDVPHFVKSLSILSKAYGQEFFANGKQCFEEGYRTGQ